MPKLIFSIEDAVHSWLGAYVASPQWIKSTVGRAYRLLPSELRRGRQYAKYRSELEEGPAVARKVGLQKLGRALRWAIETVPAYSNYSHLCTSIEDDPLAALAQIRTTSKASVKAALDDYVSKALPKGARLATFTGGSTANPMKFFLHKGISRSREYAFMDDFHRRVGLTDSDVVLTLRGRTVPTAVVPGGRLWMYEPIKRHLILSSDHLVPRFMPIYEEVLLSWRPTFIQAFPSALYPLARWLSENPLPSFTSRLRGVQLFSENVYGFQMELFKSVFSCPVLKHYGHSERVLMAASMPDDERYFFWPQYGHFELVDENGQEVTQPGILGEIVGTAYDNDVMPFIRYRTGDLAMLSGEAGHPELPGYPAVNRIEGRLQEFLVCVDSRLISICTMGAAHFDQLALVDEIQYEQRVPGHFDLKVVSRTPLSDSEKRKIEHALAAKTQGGCTATVMQVSAIERTVGGKHRMLVQHLDIDSYLTLGKNEPKPRDADRAG
ncbi:MAG: hypothetical protein HS110_01105 [Zoogloeaceae bacterium]|nr:hypothetical protein [Zoogloeaceae bacterium]